MVTDMAGTQGFGSPWHLAKRFFGALSPQGPSARDDAWAKALLLTGEQELWDRMSGPDRRHGVGVARHALRLLGDEQPRPVLAAALLHDVGKVEAGLGTFARVGVTLAAIARGRERLLGWSRGQPASRPTLRQRVGDYLEHDRLGAEMLKQAGSDPLTYTWAREHHLSSDRWSVDARVAAALKAADGD